MSWAQLDSNRLVFDTIWVYPSKAEATLFPIYHRPFRFLRVSLFSGLVEDEGQVAATTVLTILHGSHENTGSALHNIST